MVITTDIDVVAYCREIIHRKTSMLEQNDSNERIAFEVDLTKEELQEYYSSEYRRFKRAIDDVKKLISSRKNTK